MGSAAVKIKSSLPKEEDENGLDWNTSRLFLAHPTEQHIIVAYVHTGQIVEDYDGEYGSRTPVLVIDAVEHLGSILDAPEEIRAAFQARHARRTGTGRTLLDEPTPPHRVLTVSQHQLLECLEGLDLDLASLDAIGSGIDLDTGEIEIDDEVVLPEDLAELSAEVAAWPLAWKAGPGLLGEDAGLTETVAYLRVGSKRLDRYATGTAADLWPSDEVASAVVRYVCQQIMAALTVHEAVNLRYQRVRQMVFDLATATDDWDLYVPQVSDYLLRPLLDALDTWEQEHPWDAGAMDLLGQAR